MKRVYIEIAKKHFKENSQMLFLAGPRQVGKTTIAMQLQNYFKESSYYTWDLVEDRELILSGQKFIEKIYSINKLREQKPLIIFDELHKFKDWKNWLKGFYDLYKNTFSILVTGSTRLDIYKMGNDSLMGRYFLCRVCPLTIGEIINPIITESEVKLPYPVKDEIYNNLYNYGGFPDLYLKAKKTFSNKWHELRNKQLFYEDIRELSQIHEIGQIEVLAKVLQYQIGQLLNRTSLAKKIQVTVPTISKWLETLERMYYCFSIKPWHKNISRSIIKEPKIYLWDWSVIEDSGSKFENFIAVHLLKNIYLWNDLGFSKYELYFLRNKDKKEVDFIITKDDKPWILVEAKSSSNTHLSKSLGYFHKESKALFGFQVSHNEQFINSSCFDKNSLLIVPARTFLSQLY